MGNQQQSAKKETTEKSSKENSPSKNEVAQIVPAKTDARETAVKTAEVGYLNG